MKLKNIFIIAILLLTVFLIYLTTLDKKIYYLALGDSIALGDNQVSYPRLIVDYLNEQDVLEEYRYEFMKDDLRVTELITDIENNKKINNKGKEQTIKNALIKADLITLSVGNEELFYKMKTEKTRGLYDYIDEMIRDMEKLFQLMREYCKEDIFVLGYVNPFDNTMIPYIQYANQKLEALTKKYEITYVSISSIENDKQNFNTYYLSGIGQKKVAELLIPLLEHKIFLDEK